MIPPRARWPRLGAGILLCLLASCLDRQPGPPRTWTVFVAPGAPEAVRIAAQDVARYLGLMGIQAGMAAATDSQGCTPYLGRAVLVGDGLGEPRLGASATEQTWRIAETRCEGGLLVELSGGGLLGRQ